MSTIDVSFVIPARDEEILLPATLQSIQKAAQQAGIAIEMIVVNDGSTDRTAAVAEENGARLIDVELHNIGAVRNAGAVEAQAPVLFFLDADTLLPGKTLIAALKALEAGAVGGGASVDVEGVRWRSRQMVWLFTLYWQRWKGWAAGCSIFTRRADFEAVGGFDVRYFAAEERYLSDALKTRGRFVILPEAVMTSGRKLRIYSLPQMMRIAYQALIVKRGQLTSRDGLEILYDAPRETAPTQPK